MLIASLTMYIICYIWISCWCGVCLEVGSCVMDLHDAPYDPNDEYIHLKCWQKVAIELTYSIDEPQ